MALLQSAGLRLDDASRDFGELGELGSEELAGWSGADDEDVDFGGETGLEVGFAVTFVLQFERVAGAFEAIEVELEAAVEGHDYGMVKDQYGAG